MHFPNPLVYLVLRFLLQNFDRKCPFKIVFFHALVYFQNFLLRKPWPHVDSQEMQELCLEAYVKTVSIQSPWVP